MALDCKSIAMLHSIVPLFRSDDALAKANQDALRCAVIRLPVINALNVGNRAF